MERHAWIPAINAEYLVGVDGLSLLLVLLTSLIIPFAFLAQPAPDRSRAFYATMLVMQSALYGTFTAQNFVLWFLFYEMSLIPGFLLIKIWGGENRDRAATKFFLYTFLGSVAMLLSFLGIYFAKGTFDFAALANLGKSGLLTGNFAWVAFAGIFVGLAVKVPLFPFHTWLPDAYQTAPTGVSMVLTGVLSKMGVYGFVRLLLPLFPNEIKIIGPWLLSAGGLLDRVRSAGCVGAARFETNGRLSVDQPSRLLHAGSVCADRVVRCCCERSTRTRR